MRSNKQLYLEQSGGGGWSFITVRAAAATKGYTVYQHSSQICVYGKITFIVIFVNWCI